MTPEIYEKYQQNNIILRYFISILFCNEIWFFSSAPLINGPIWSLSYEFWYYVIFGAFFYKKQGIKGYIIALAVCLFAGPKVMLLMVMWLLGWLVYHLPKLEVSDTFSWLVMIILLTLSAYLIAFLPSMPNGINTTKLHWADKYISDFVVSIFIGAAFYFLPNGHKAESVLVIVKGFRKLADLTFPIYVLHFPLLVLSQSLLLRFSASRTTFFWMGLFFVLGGCSIMGALLETNRKRWVSLFSVIFNKKI